jgi:hypothetical protein
LAVFVLCPALAASAAGPAPARTVDNRYSPPTWHAALGFPGDWHEPMANERGALLADFGPGPYAKPLTEVEFVLAAGEPRLERQRWADDATPVLTTELTLNDAQLRVTTFALPPAEPAASLAHFPAYERLDGITGAKGWAKPREEAAPEFSSVAWGTNRPIRYRVRVTPGAAKRVVLGFCESWKPRLNERVAAMQVEGAPVQTVDLALTAARHAPQVFTFAARDDDANGWIDVTVSAPVGHDPNTTLSYLAVYAADAKFTREDLLTGRGAELRIDCGVESDALPPRQDIVSAVATGSDLVLRVKTGRTLAWDAATGALRDAGRPFLTTQPRAVAAEPTEGGWRLTFPSGTRAASAVLLSGRVDDATLTTAQALDPAAALAQARARWQQPGPLPDLPVQLGDPALTRLARESLRIVYQTWENVEGRGQFNSSFTLYRGLWAGDVVYVVELATLLGDHARAREQLRTLWAAQNAAGLIDEMPPLRLNRTTGATLWVTARAAELTGDLAFARENWPAIRRAVAALGALRDSTLNSGAPYAGLLPPGFNDGGIMEVTAEYSSVYWSITGIRATAALAARLGETEDQRRFAALAAQFEGSFRTAAQRDLRRDPAGNAFLPVRVAHFSPDDPPPLAQWAVLEAGLFGDWLPRDGELLTGTVAMLRRAEVQGLPASTGWMRDGIWAGYGSLYAHLPLLRDERDHAIDLLYAIANHASPVGGWIEEQSIQGAPLKLAGDQPHCWAAALYVRLAVAMLAHERGDEVHLLAGLAPEWLGQARVNAVRALPTRVGLVSVSVETTADGRRAFVRASAPPRGRAVLHLAALREAGFAVPDAPGGRITLAPGETRELTLDRPLSLPR